jgi:hypothetical protein
VKVKKIQHWAISSQAPQKVKVQRLGESRTYQVVGKCKAPEMGEDIV